MEEIINENGELMFYTTKVESLRAELAKVIVGQSSMIDTLILGILNGGHVLIEGVPGIAKTLAANAFAKTLNSDFSRIQFTPDLMPTDITGTNVFNAQKSNFEYKKGPVFTNILLIDEINRAPAKTQSALFEIMEEKQISYDGQTYVMGFPFMTIATQNPIEQEGTYRLPEAQLDRFLFRVLITYPSYEEEVEVLNRFLGADKNFRLGQLQSVLNVDDLKRMMALQSTVYVKREILEYIVNIVSSTRSHADIYVGASPRASLALMHVSQSCALLNGRDFVTPDDVRQFAFEILNHRIILNPESEMAGKTEMTVLNEVISQVEVPR